MTLTDIPPAARILQLATASWMSAAVSAVANLGVADALADGPRSSDAIAADVGAHPPTLYRLLRACVDFDLFVESGNRVFELTAVGQALRTDSPISMRSFARWVGEPADRHTWSDLSASIRTGRPAFDLAHGHTIWDHLANNEYTATIFNDAMTSASNQMIAPAVAAYDFSQFRTVVDVGGGHGALLSEVLVANPTVRGILYDQPDVTAGAEKTFQHAGVSERVDIRSGSFFDSVPEGGDAYLLSNVIHDWDDDASTRILDNVRAVLPPEGRLLLVEVLMPEPGYHSPTVKLMDLNMLVLCGGKQRTEAEFGSLFDGAGLTLTDVVPGGFCSIVEGIVAR